MINRLPFLIVLLALSACTTTSLSPAPGARRDPASANVAIGEFASVTVTVQADAWPGSSAVSRTVEPLQVTINNGGTRPIRVRYGDFALIAPDGRRYSALPPFRVQGQLLDPMLADGYLPYPMPGFRYRRFYVAPYYAPIYPGIPVYGGFSYYLYDPFYYEFYYRNLLSTIQPTMEMLDLALPEGVIEPGGSVTGFLYFQRVSRNETSVAFRQDLVEVGDGSGPTGAAGADIGQISIPFMVTRERG